MGTPSKGVRRRVKKSEESDERKLGPSPLSEVAVEVVSGTVKGKTEGRRVRHEKKAISVVDRGGPHSRRRFREGSKATESSTGTQRKMKGQSVENPEILSEAENIKVQGHPPFKRILGWVRREKTDGNVE